MINYTGKYSPGMKQYMAAKPCKYGIKVWALCNSDSKYVQKFEFYIRAQGDEVEEYGQGCHVVSRLLEVFEHKGHFVCCNNFFTLVNLFYDMLNRGICATGTARIERVVVSMGPGEERGTKRYRMHIFNKLCGLS